MRSCRLLNIVTALVLPLLAGCGSSDPATRLYSVSGTVKFDGAPIPEGRILFRATTGEQRGYSAEIRNGKYELKAPAGKMRVEIIASRPIPGKFDESNPGEKNPVGEMYIPARYNTESELTAEVQAGRNTIDFDNLSSGTKPSQAK